MGLDMYAYVGYKGQREEHYDAGVWNPETREFESPVAEPQEIAYWRKHPNLHGWMEQLWERKLIAEGRDNPHTFNGIELELNWNDIDNLEKDIKSGVIAKMNTTGFFFGNPSDDYYYEQDLKFCVDAKAELFLGRKVFYNSSW